MFDCSDSRMIYMMKTNPSESAIKTQDTRMGEDFHSILEEYQGLVERCLQARPEISWIKSRTDSWDHCPSHTLTLMYQDSLNWQNHNHIKQQLCGSAWGLEVKEHEGAGRRPYSGVHDLDQKYFDLRALKYLRLPRRIRRRKKLAIVFISRTGWAVTGFLQT